MLGTSPSQVPVEDVSRAANADESHAERAIHRFRKGFAEHWLAENGNEVACRHRTKLKVASVGRRNVEWRLAVDRSL
jgi:hypothetical protein